MSESTQVRRPVFGLIGVMAVLALGLVAAGHSASASSATIFSENFNSIVQSYTGTQVHTGLTVGAWDTLADWTSEGTNAVHDVDLIAGSAKDIAVSFFKDNVITMSSGVSANALGTTYSVSLDVGPSVWADAHQASTSTDGLIIYVLRADNSVLYSSTQKSGVWNGTSSAQTLTPREFSYLGDGSGPVRLRIGTILYEADRFGGAVDNIRIESMPSTCSPISSTSGGSTILKFTTVGTCSWSVPSGVSSVQALVVGGGGGGSSDVGGGGGGGQVVATTVNVSGTVAIKVGAGGVFGWQRMYNDTAGGKTGGRSAIGSVAVALGGSGANGRFSNNLNPDGSANNTGFTGGGGPYEDCGGCNAGNTGTGGASFKGGNGSGNGGGGGGGAAAAGADRVDGAAGGIGVVSTITGTSMHYGGGGGGGAYPNNVAIGLGGLGGGGDGVAEYNTRGESGLDGRGGGGGGAASDGNQWGHGGMGGSGVVIIKFGTPAITTTTSSTTTTTTTSSTSTTAPTSSTVPAAVVIDIQAPTSSGSTVPLGQASIATIAPGVKTEVTNPISTTTVPVAVTPMRVPSNSETAPKIPEVSAGEGALDIGGVSTKVDVSRENNQIVVKSGSLLAVLSGLDDKGSTRALDDDGNLRLAGGDVVKINVGGFKPGSDVDVWLFSTPKHLGTSVVGANGEVSGSFTIPADVESGSHRIAVTAKLPNGKSATFTLGIAVGDIARSSTLTRILIAIPIALAVLAGFLLPNQMRRRRRLGAA
jgi:hypothetical protein